MELPIVTSNVQRLDWVAKAPEVGSCVKSDIWIIGITALEMGYGETAVAFSKELLANSGYKSNKCELPNTWDELRMEAENLSNNGGEKQINKKKLIKKKNRGDQDDYSIVPFSKFFIYMVAMCLAGYQENRPTTDKLLQHNFFKNCKNVEYFKDVLV